MTLKSEVEDVIYKHFGVFEIPPRIWQAILNDSHCKRYADKKKYAELALLSYGGIITLRPLRRSFAKPSVQWGYRFLLHGVVSELLQSIEPTPKEGDKFLLAVGERRLTFIDAAGREYPVKLPPHRRRRRALAAVQKVDSFNMHTANGVSVHLVPHALQPAVFFRLCRKEGQACAVRGCPCFEDCTRKRPARN